MATHSGDHEVSIDKVDPDFLIAANKVLEEWKAEEDNVGAKLFNVSYAKGWMCDTHDGYNAEWDIMYVEYWHPDYCENDDNITMTIQYMGGDEPEIDEGW